MPDIIKTTPWPRRALLLLSSLLGLQIIAGCAARVTPAQAPDYAASPQYAGGVFHNQSRTTITTIWMAVLMENGGDDPAWPAVHMQPEEGLQAFLDLRGKVLIPVHNSSFDLAFHTWRAPLDAIARLADEREIELATPELGEALTLGQPRSNVRWWIGMK